MAAVDVERSDVAVYWAGNSFSCGPAAHHHNLTSPLETVVEFSAAFTCIEALGTPSRTGPTGVDKGGPGAQPPSHQWPGKKEFFVKIEEL